MLKKIWRAVPLSQHQKKSISRQLQVHRTVSVALGRYAKPQFVVIGVQRGGTTSIFNYLARHPHFQEPMSKEIHFFDLSYHKGANWYWGFFPLSADPNIVTADVSPYYIFHPQVPQRIAETLPTATRFVALLRDPIARAYSHYTYMIKLGNEKRPFEEAIAPDMASISSAESPLDVIKDEWAHRHHTYISRGVYVTQLQRWFDLFPRENFLILRSEEVFTDTSGTFGQLMDFVGLDKTMYPTDSFPASNAGKYEGAMNESTRDMLRTFYRPYNQQLSELLDMNFDLWDE